MRQGEPAPSPARDTSLLWLGLAVAIWGATGGLLLLPLPESPAQALRTVLSSANSGCLLISASHLDYGPAVLQRASDYPRWNQIALIGSLAVALVTIALYAAFGPAEPAARLPDFVLSAVTLVLYGLGLFRSFRRRGFAPLAILAAVAIALQFTGGPDRRYLWRTEAGAGRRCGGSRRLGRGHVPGVARAHRAQRGILSAC